MTETFSRDGHDVVTFPLSFRTRLMLLLAVMSPRGWMKLHVYYTRTVRLVPAEAAVKQPVSDTNKHDNGVFYERAIRCVLWVLLVIFVLAGSVAYAVCMAVIIIATYYERDESFTLEIGNSKKTNA